MAYKFKSKAYKINFAKASSPGFSNLQATETVKIEGFEEELCGSEYKTK
jgi:hypothetical protein